MSISKVKRPNQRVSVEGELTDKVVFINADEEALYSAVMTAMDQLHQAGVLAQQKAIVLGAFTEYRKSPLDRGFDLKGVIRHVRSLTSVPILTGLPFGHVPTKVCLPVGRKVTLSVQGRDAFMLW